jgi:hypothetical protein
MLGSKVNIRCQRNTTFLQTLHHKRERFKENINVSREEKVKRELLREN